MRVLAAALVGAVVVAGACSRGGGPEDSARLVVHDGSATVTAVDGESTVVTGVERVAFGDTVTVDAGTVTMSLAGGPSYELRAGVPGTRILVGSPPELLAGDVLLADGFPAAVAHKGLVLTAHGAVRLDAEDRIAAVYIGRTEVSGLTGIDAIAALRQQVLAPSVPPRPLDYDPTDAWDREYLAEAVAFGDRLEALARGLTGDLPSGRRDGRFFEAVLPDLAAEVDFGDDLLEPDREVGETLIGAAITVLGRRDSFRERWAAVFSFRDEGAFWGLVALDQGVNAAPVLDTIELAIDQAPEADRQRPAATTTTSTTSSTTSSLPGPVDETSTTTSTTTTTVPPDDPIGGVADAIDELIGGILESVITLDLGPVETGP